MSEAKQIPTTEKLAQALELANAPVEMVARARAGYYDDFKSPVPTPILFLVNHCEYFGLADIAQRAEDGEFDAQKWEADEWGQTQEAQTLFSKHPWAKGKKR